MLGPMVCGFNTSNNYVLIVGLFLNIIKNNISAKNWSVENADHQFTVTIIIIIKSVFP